MFDKEAIRKGYVRYILEKLQNQIDTNGRIQFHNVSEANLPGFIEAGGKLMSPIEAAGKGYLKDTETSGIGISRSTGSIADKKDVYDKIINDGKVSKSIVNDMAYEQRIKDINSRFDKLIESAKKAYKGDPKGLESEIIRCNNIKERDLSNALEDYNAVIPQVFDLNATVAKASRLSHGKTDMGIFTSDGRPLSMYGPAGVAVTDYKGQVGSIPGHEETYYGPIRLENGDLELPSASGKLYYDPQKIMNSAGGRQQAKQLKYLGAIPDKHIMQLLRKNKVNTAPNPFYKQLEDDLKAEQQKKNTVTEQPSLLTRAANWLFGRK